MWIKSCFRTLGISFNHWCTETDAAWSPDFCGVGGLIRDHSGCIVAAFTRRKHRAISALHTEIVAGLEGCNFALAHRFLNIAFESDSQLLVYKLMNEKPDISALGSLINHLKSLCSSFTFVSFSQIFFFFL